MIQKHTELKRRLGLLYRDKSAIIERIKSISSEKLALIDQKEKLYSELERLKEEKKNLLEQARTYSEQAKKALSEAKRYLNEAKKLTDEFNGIIEDIGLGLRKIENEIRKREKAINSGTLTPEEEKRVIMEISELEMKKKRYKEALKLKEKVLELKIMSGKWKIEAKSLRQKVNQYYTQIDSINAKIEDVVKKAKELKEIIQSKRDEINQRITSLKNELNDVKMEIHKIINIEEEKERKRTEELLKRKLIDIQNKIKKKQKLTIEELQILFKEGKNINKGENA